MGAAMRYQPQGRAQLSPLARQLGARSLVLPSGGVLAELASRLTVVPSGLTRTANQQGIAFANGGSGSASILGALQSQTFSRIAIISLTSMSSSGTISDSMGGNTGGAQWRAEPSGEMVLNKSNVSQVGISSGAGLTTGRAYVVGITCDGGTTSFFVDGRYVGGGAGSASFNADGTGSLFTRGAGGEKLNGAIGLHVDMPPQSQAMMRALTANPWALLDAGSSSSAYLAAIASAGSAAAPASVAASLAWTEADDVTTLAATLADRASIAWTEASDVFLALATETDREVLSWSEPDDVWALVANEADRITIGWTEASDSTQLSGTVLPNQASGVAGAIAWAEANDVMTLVGVLRDRGAVAWAEQDDLIALAAHADTPPIITASVRFDILPRNFNLKTVHFSN